MHKFSWFFATSSGLHFCREETELRRAEEQFFRRSTVPTKCMLSKQSPPCLWVNPYLIITLGSCVTPQVMMALVPLITLWSCGGVVIRVRAAVTNQRLEGIENSQRNLKWTGGRKNGKWNSEDSFWLKWHAGNCDFFSPPWWLVKENLQLFLRVKELSVFVKRYPSLKTTQFFHLIFQILFTIQPIKTWAFKQEEKNK